MRRPPDLVLGEPPRGLQPRRNLEGQLFALMTMTVAAAEAVVGLAILVDIFRVRDVDDVDELSELRG